MEVRVICEVPHHFHFNLSRVMMTLKFSVVSEKLGSVLQITGLEFERKFTML